MTLIGAFVVLYPSFFIGIRHWLEQDTLLIFKDSKAATLNVLAWTDAKSSSFRYRFTLLLYWQEFWNGYWSERTIAVENNQKTGQLADSPPEQLRSTVTPFYDFLKNPGESVRFANTARSPLYLFIVTIIVFLVLALFYRVMISIR